MPKTLMGVREAAGALGVHENTIRNWERNGLLRAVRLPRSGYRRFNPEDIERMRREMFEQLAPADTGPEFRPKRRPQGRFRHADD